MALAPKPTQRPCFRPFRVVAPAKLAPMAREEDLADNGNTRWATLNAGAISGNILVIAADLDDTTPDDYFKIAALEPIPWQKMKFRKRFFW